jgi:protein O-mannosyl-transferase
MDQQKHDRPATSPRAQLVFVGAALALLTGILYLRTAGFDFVKYDDDIYVTGNRAVLNGLTPEGIGWAFTTFHSFNWHPLTWLSLMLDISLFGPKAGALHLINLLFHIANSLLLLFILYRLTSKVWPGALVAALFALHPQHVESVAWIAERKDVLSTFFWMLAVASYLRYVRLPSVSRYMPVFTFFALGLMAKPMIVTLPFILLLVDFWPLGRLQFRGAFALGSNASLSTQKQKSKQMRLPAPARTEARGISIFNCFFEKIPLCVLAIASCIVTFLAQKQGGAVVSLETIPMGMRLANAAIAYVQYLVKMAWPIHLAPLYPYPQNLDRPFFIMCAILIAGCTIFCIRSAKQHPYLLTGWLFYLESLVPVIGLVQVGPQFMADRYSYLPSIGISIMLVGGIGALLQRFAGFRKAALAAGVMGVAGLTAASWVQVGYWKDSETLFTHAIAVTPVNPFMQNNLGFHYFERGDMERAIPYFLTALRQKSDYNDARYNLGSAYARQGKHADALAELEKVIAANPFYAKAYENIGIVYGGMGRHHEAEINFRKALQCDPSFLDARANLGTALLMQNKIEDAIAEYSAVLKIAPAHKTAWAALDDLMRKYNLKQPQTTGSAKPQFRY